MKGWKSFESVDGDYQGINEIPEDSVVDLPNYFGVVKKEAGKAVVYRFETGRKVRAPKVARIIGKNPKREVGDDVLRKLIQRNRLYQ